MFGLIFGETDLPHKILKVLKKKRYKIYHYRFN